MSRSFTLLLLLMCLVSSCALPFYKLTVSSDAYVASGSDKFGSHRVFLVPDVSEQDLSKLPYYQKIDLGLSRRDVDMVSSIEKSDLVLFFDVEVQSPVRRTDYSLGKTSGTTSTVTETDSEGKSKTIEIETDGEWKSYPYDYVTYRKVLTLKLYTRNTDKLVWQSTTVIDDKIDTYAPYVNSLVYTALSNFMRNTPIHPELTQIGGRKKQYIDDLLGESNE
jgi:hypothetical protein